MGTISGYEYPDHTVDEAVDIVEIIADEGITDKELLADRLGHENAESGAFRNKLTSLRRYGLIPKRGEITLTQLAERIVVPEPGTNEREEAIGEAVENVDLLARLYDRYDYQEPDENFFYQIAQITGADRAEAKDKSSRIERLYRAGLKYVRILHENEVISQESPQTGSGLGSFASTESVEQPSIEAQSPPSEADATLIIPDGTTIHIKNKATYRAAEAILDDIAEEYGINSDSESNSDNMSEERTINDYQDQD